MILESLCSAHGPRRPLPKLHGTVLISPIMRPVRRPDPPYPLHARRSSKRCQATVAAMPWPLIPRRTHPDIVLLFRRQDNRHGLRMDRRDDGISPQCRTGAPASEEFESVALAEIATAMLRKHQSDLGAALLKLGWVGNDVFDDQTSCCFRERSVATKLLSNI
jgi:hypothetical protein